MAVVSLATWAEQDRHPGVRIWRSGPAIVVASPDVRPSRRKPVSRHTIEQLAEPLNFPQP